MFRTFIKEMRSRFYNTPLFKHANAHDYHVTSAEGPEIAQALYWAERKPFLRIHLPVEVIVMEGALHYSSACNPFVAALKDGPDALAKQYELFQPTDLCEMYRLERRGLKGEDLPVNFLPWIFPGSDKVDKGEMGLGPEHGVSYFGPVTRQKFDLEIKRLQTTLESIVTKGYLPQRHGDISGYFMRNGSDLRFKIRGGKHRAAALVYLENQTLPVRMKAGWPRIIDRAHAAEWPAVYRGQMDIQLALDIFDRFFDNQTLEEIQAYKS